MSEPGESGMATNYHSEPLNCLYKFSTACCLKATKPMTKKQTKSKLYNPSTIYTCANFGPQKVHFKAKIDSFLTFQCAKTLNLYLFNPNPTK